VIFEYSHVFRSGGSLLVFDHKEKPLVATLHSCDYALLGTFVSNTILVVHYDEFNL
jgi:hypothetical protein